LIQRDALRYSPAGIAFLVVEIEHRSDLTQAGIARTVEFATEVKVAGAAAVSMEKLPLGSLVRCKGFLAKRSLKSKQLLFNVNEYEILEK
jgi:primosomal replication protein N